MTTNAFVLLTAMPPTTGHLQLIQFANRLIGGDGKVKVILNTQPHEPFVNERYSAIKWALRRANLAENVDLIWFDKTLEQDPSTPGFWPMWVEIMREAGMNPGDLIVASETYGKRLAAETNGRFFPYDLGRSLNPSKATLVRENPYGNFSNILPEFQPCLQTTVTVFGAESTGKTTLSRELADVLHGHWLFEYARPFLENTSIDINVQSMMDIWRGQSALQRQVIDLPGRPHVIQDTDLFSTVGYWRLPHWLENLGPCPRDLELEAIRLQSDLYLFTPSTIPFEEDPIRYGGGVREGSDEYWLNICDTYDLPYVVLKSNSREGRLLEATAEVRRISKLKAAALEYDRMGF